MSAWQAQRDLIKIECDKFPSTFGLRAYRGKTFRVNFEASFISENIILIYTDVQREDGTWVNFAKGTVGEIRAQLVVLS